MRNILDPLKVGDIVSYSDVAAERGLITERVCDSYVRVLWYGASVPTTCRASNLARLRDPEHSLH